MQRRLCERSGTLFLFVWTAVASGTTIASKFLYDAFDFTFPTFVTAWQSGVAAVALIVLVAVRSRKRALVSRLPPMRFAVALSVFAAATLILDNLSLTYNNFGTYFFFTTVGLPMFSLLRWLFLGEGSTFSSNVVFIVLLLSVIAIVATDFDINKKGIRYGLLSAFCSSAHRTILLRWVRFKSSGSPYPRSAAEFAGNLGAPESHRNSPDDGYRVDPRESCLSSNSDLHLRSSRSASPSSVASAGQSGEGKYSPGTSIASAFISMDEAAVLTCLQMCVTVVVATLLYPLLDSSPFMEYPVALSRKLLIISVALFVATTLGSILMNFTFNISPCKPSVASSYSQAIPSSDAYPGADLKVSHILPRSPHLLFYSPLVNQMYFFPFPAATVCTHSSHVVLFSDSKRGGDKYDRSSQVAVAYTKSPRFTLLLIEVVRSAAFILVGLWALCVSFQMNNFGFQLVALFSLAFFMLMRSDIRLINELTGLPGTARWGKAHGGSCNDDESTDMLSVNAARKRKENAV